MSQALAVVDKLCAASRKNYQNPYLGIEWPDAIGSEEWCFSPELLSLYGTEYYDALTDAQKIRLSFNETVNFFSLNIHGEKPLVEGLAFRLYRGPGAAAVNPYLHHFLDEENKHMLYFGTFCQRYAGKIYPERKVAFPRQYAPGEEDFLFFAKVMIFEEIVDVYNREMAADTRLTPVVREINRLHHLDEVRHLSFGRRHTQDLFDEYKPRWSEETLAGVRGYLASYLKATWREYYNPDMYLDTGIGGPFQVASVVATHPSSKARERRIQADCVAYLQKNEMIAPESHS
jgi:P-aminobenzoate N-oxygenase AurF